MVLIDFDPVVGHEQQGTRRALVVSHESFHRSGMATVCPISARAPRYPGEIVIPSGHAGQTRDGVVLCHQVRTVDLRRVTAWEVGGRVQYVEGPLLRRHIRMALAHQLGLDLLAALDGAA